MSDTVNIRELNDLVAAKSDFINLIQQGMDQTIVGQKHLIDSLLIALLSNGHVLLEGVPGLAKTLAIKTLAQVIDAKYSRIQFTPDILPADVIGTMMYSVKSEQFQVKKGPIFANFILADEFTREPPPDPIEQEGTYPLPEAQVDRFLLKVVIGYPTKEEEKIIIRQNITNERKEIRPLLKPQEILEAQKVCEKIYIDEKIERYFVDIVFATRFPADYSLNDLVSIISFGASPRASISLARAARSYAFLRGRGYVVPEDVRAVAHDVLRHRIGLTYEAEANNITTDDIVSEILDKVEVP